MKRFAIAIILASVALSGCNKDCKKGGRKPPTDRQAEKVPDSPSGLKLSAIAAAALAAYAMSCYQREGARRG